MGPSIHLCGLFSIREDLLDPSPEVKSQPTFVGDDSTVNPSAVYDQTELPRPPNKMTVGDLKRVLESQGAENKLCLDESQREAVYSSLSRPLTLIQVHVCTSTDSNYGASHWDCF